MIQPFHLAIKIHNLDEARTFYGELLGFEEGRSNNSWIDWNFFGHQLVTHLDNSLIIDNIINLVDNKNIPVPHFGVVLKWEEWHKFAKNLKNKKIKFNHFTIIILKLIVPELIDCATTTNKEIANGINSLRWNCNFLVTAK